MGSISILERLGGTLLGKWHLDALIGEGGMAAVYAATHRNGARGAVKLLHSSDPEQVSRFVREGYIANHVEHAAVVRVLDDDIAEDGTPFLVMELLEGKSLEELASEQGGRLPAMEVLRVMSEVLDALAAAHDHGIVHRDIKPENIFVTLDGKVKLLDFGIAHLPEGCGPPSTKTDAGQVMGTPAFMSPEQARGRWELVGPASDVWGVGATMFTLLSGRFVHDEETGPELRAAIFTKSVRSLKEVLPKATPPVVALVDRALQRRIADRWESAREMRLALLEVEAALVRGDRHPSSSSLTSTLVERQAPPVRRRRAALGALDACSAILLLALSARSLDARAQPVTAGHLAGALLASGASPPPLVDVTEGATAMIGQPTPECPASRPIDVVPTVGCSVVSEPPTGVPTRPVTRRVDGAPTHRNLYDRRH